MRAAVVTGIRMIEIRDIPMPQLRNDELRVRVAAVGICGSDLHTYTEGSTTGRQDIGPLVLGHEFAGVVTADNADLLGVEPGTVVAIDPARPCGVCEWCRRGDTNLCPDVRFLGYPPNNGAMTEFVCVSREAIHVLPAGMNATTGVLLETLGVAIHALDLAKVRLGETVIVLGCGPVGLLASQVASVAGAGKIIAVDPVGYRRDIARRFGAAESYASAAEAVAALDGRGADLVIEATDSKHGFDHATRSARIGGRIVMVGIPEGNSYTIAASEARRKGLSVKFSRRMPEVYPRAIAMVQSGKVKLDGLATHSFALEDAQTAFDLQVDRKDGIVKAIIRI